jgi:CRISPR/Cas system CSM-associated protein Csm2 small subunit
MNNENKYQFINNLPKEYHQIFWDIMISAESDKELGVRFYKSQCKLIMRYLYKKDKEIERLRKENEKLKEDIKFCINTMKNEYECTDKRTNRELHTMVEILEKWTKEYKEGSD